MNLSWKISSICEERHRHLKTNKLCLFHTFMLSQYLVVIINIFLGSCFAKSTLNSIDLFHSLPQDLELNRSYLESSVVGSFLGFQMVGFSLGSWALGIPH